LLAVTRRPLFVTAVAAIALAVTTAIACEIRVRDSAFRTARDTHRLCVIADSNDAAGDETYERLSSWLDHSDDTMNLEVVRVDADDPETNWRTIGIPSAPPTLPVTVLVGRNNGAGENFVIDHWEPQPTDEDLAAILDSPLRRQLAELLASSIAVLIFAPGDPNSGQPNISESLDAIVATGIADERIGLSMLTIDRTDPKEQLLCRFMGLRAGSPDTLCVAFGRGKLMTPPLQGDAITADNINQLVFQIRQACSCSQPLPTMGVDLPLTWSDAIDSSVVLMDQELDLSQLESEVENMLAAKATAIVSGDPTIVPIPAGRPPVPEMTYSLATDFSLIAVAMVGVLAAIMVAVIIAAVIVTRRRSTENSSPS
jgi:hypothetical protein